MAVDILPSKGDILRSSLFRLGSTSGINNDANSGFICLLPKLTPNLNWHVITVLVNTPPAIPSFSHGPNQPLPYSCIHHAFAHHAERAPQAIAAITQGGEGERINYGQLYVSSSRVARKLYRAGVKQGDRVIILSRSLRSRFVESVNRNYLAQRSIPLLVGMFAILKAGAAYVPLDGGIVTDSCLAHVALDSGATVVMVGKEWHQRVDKLNEDLSANGSPTVTKLILEEVVKEAENNLDDSAVQEELNDEFKTTGKGSDGCYVIYTSG